MNTDVERRKPGVAGKAEVKCCRCGKRVEISFYYAESQRQRAEKVKTGALPGVLSAETDCGGGGL